MTDEDSVVHEIGAHPLKRRGVDVEGDRRVRASVAYAVNVGRREVKDAAYGACAIARSAIDNDAWGRA